MASMSNAPFLKLFKVFCRFTATASVCALNVFFILSMSPREAQPNISPGAYVAIVVAVLLALWLSGFIVHEMGHFLAARINGMFVIEVGILWLVFTAKGRGYRLSVSRKYKSYRGWVRAYPDPGKDIRHQVITMTASGPAANLLIALMTAPVALWLYEPDMSHSFLIMLFICLINIHLAVFNLLPVGTKNISDGTKLYRWIFKSDERITELVTLRLMGQSIHGVRSSELLPEDIQVLENDPEQTYQLLGGMASMRSAMDRNDMRSAVEVIEKYKKIYEEFPPDKHASLKNIWYFFLFEEAYIGATFQKSADAARKELAAATTATLPDFMLLRLEAAANYAESRMQDANRCLEKARGALVDHYDIGTKLEELALLDDLESRIKA